MGQKFTDFVKIKKSEKKVPLYKAFPFIGEDDEMKINENIDLLALSPEAAIANYFRTVDINELRGTIDRKSSEFNDIFLASIETLIETFGKMSDFKGGSFKAKKDNDLWTSFDAKRLMIPIAVVYVDADDLRTQDLIDNGDPFFENEVISITLKGKKIEIDLEEKFLVSFQVKIDNNGHTRIKNIVVEDA